MKLTSITNSEFPPNFNYYIGTITKSIVNKQIYGFFLSLARSLCVSYVFSFCRCRFMSWRCQQQLLTCNCFDHFKWYVHRFVHMTAINGGNSDDKNHRVYQIFLSVDCYSLSVFCCLVTVILIFRIA